MVRVDAKINFDWNRVAPAADFPAKTFAVRWTGELLPPAAGDYVLGLRGPRPIDGRLMTGEACAAQAAAGRDRRIASGFMLTTSW